MLICKPNRMTHSSEQIIHGSIEEIFPLYCPVKEALWTEGWDPKVVYSRSGVVEPECVFITEDKGIASAWFVTVYDITQGQVEMIKHTPEVTMSKLKIRVKKISEKTTRALISYTITALSNAGDAFLKEFTKENYDISMDAWEKAMNHYLKTGKMSTGLPRF